jgi:hypothetical protein
MNEADISIQDEYGQASDQLENLHQTALALEQNVAEEYKRLWQAFRERYPLLNCVPQISLSEVNLKRWFEQRAIVRRD